MVLEVIHSIFVPMIDGLISWIVLMFIYPYWFFFFVSLSDKSSILVCPHILTHLFCLSLSPPPSPTLARSCCCCIIFLVIVFICFFPCFILLMFSLICIYYVYFKFLSWLFSIHLTCCMLSDWMFFMETILVGYLVDLVAVLSIGEGWIPCSNPCNSCQFNERGRVELQGLENYFWFSLCAAPFHSVVHF